MKTTLILPLLAVAAIAGGCGGGKSSGAAASSGGGYGSGKPTATQAAKAPAGKPAAGTAVEISGFAFHPNAIKVHVGDTITFRNKDSTAHTATATEGAKFDSGSLEQGKSFAYTAKRAGTIKFVCDFHPSMTGTIVVS
jgi:plastocyanin